MYTRRRDGLQDDIEQEEQGYEQEIWIICTKKGEHLYNPGLSNSPDEFCRKRQPWMCLKKRWRKKKALTLRLPVE